MCGLYGYKTKDDAKLTFDQLLKRERTLQALAVAMQTRGEDSTGIAYYSNKWDIVKKTEPASKFFELEQVKRAMDKKPTCIIGHTRFATIGDITDKNAHPFKFDNIIGCHNGSVYNYLEIDAKVSVDSEVIFKLLAENKQDYKKTFKRLSGVFAITWTDNKHLYIARHGNPLHCAYVEELKTLFWASELNYIIPIMVANGLKYKLGKISENKVYCIDGQLNTTEQKVKFKEYNPVIIPSWSGYNKSIDSEDYAYMAEEYAEQQTHCFYCQQNIIGQRRYWLTDTDEVVCETCKTHYCKDLDAELIA